MRTVTRAAMRTRIRERSDTVGDQHISDTMINDLINECYRELYDELVSAGPPDYFLGDAQYTLLAGDDGAIDLGTVAPTFYKLRRVYSYNTGTQKKRILEPATPEQIQFLKPAPDGETILIEFIPHGPEVSADISTIPDVDGWSELVVLEVCIKIALRKAMDPGPYAQEQERIRRRVRRTTVQDVGSPPKLVRTRLRNQALMWPTTSGQATHYRLYAPNTLLVYQLDPGWP